ncbi:MAG: Gfo/Idh/MocA family protein [Opitutales bacterium]
MKRKLRMGMVGGGHGGFIGGVHRIAAQMDGQIELVAGCFSSDPKKSKASGKDFHVAPERTYTDWKAMLKAESEKPADARLDFISVVVPNWQHCPISKACLLAGFNVVCDKPLGLSLKEALDLRKTVKASGKVFALTHNYTGYPIVKHARALVASGQLGKLIKVVVEYPQGYMTPQIEAKAGTGMARWRTDPKKSGISNATADIGTHAENLARYITGLEIEELCAELTSFIPGDPLETDSNILIRYKGGARGILFASQIMNGEENDLNIRVYGTKGSLEWHQEQPNELMLKAADQPRQIHTRGNSAYLSKVAGENNRLPWGHPEGFIEAFANTYLNAAQAIRDEVSGKKPPKKGYDFPTIEDGVIGMALIETAVKSSKAKQKWVKFPSV